MEQLGQNLKEGDSRFRETGERVWGGWVDHGMVLMENGGQ